MHSFAPKDKCPIFSMRFSSFFRNDRIVIGWVGLFLLVSSLGFVVPVRAQTENPAKSEASDLDPAVEAGIKEALASFNNADFVGSLELLKKLYAAHPNLAPPRIIAAQWFAQANLGEPVRVSLEQATAETPEDPEAYLLLGEILLRQRFLTAAELLFETGKVKLDAYQLNAERKKNLISSYYRNAISLAETRNRWEPMLELTDEALKHDGEKALLFRQKGVALFQLNRYDEAFAAFQEADLHVKEDDIGLPAEAAMSQLYQLHGDRENAQKYLDQALQKYPKLKEVVILKVQSLLNDDKLEEAQQLIQQLVQDLPDWMPGVKLQATIALYLSDYKRAENLFQQLILVNPSDDQAANGLALAQCEQDDVQQRLRALSYAQDNVQKHGDNSDYWATLGWVLYKNDQLEQSAQALKQSAATGRVNAATAYYLARLALKTGKSAEAVTLLEAALDSPAPFAKRRDAAKLLQELKK